MIAFSALADDLQFYKFPNASLHARNARPDFLSNVAVGRKTKTLLVGMRRQAVINCDADRLESVAVLIEKHFADPVPIAISYISYLYFFIRHGRE